MSVTDYLDEYAALNGHLGRSQKLRETAHCIPARGPRNPGGQRGPASCQHLCLASKTGYGPAQPRSSTVDDLEAAIAGGPARSDVPRQRHWVAPSRRWMVRAA